MRFAISQRVDIHVSRGERRDALDQAWGPALDRLCGRPACLIPVPNRPGAAEALLNLSRPDCLVLSGGNDLGEAPERDGTEAAMLRYAARHRAPVLAVCRGMQMVQHHLGGALRRVAGHLACNHAIRAAPGSGLPDLLVNSYHAWGVDAAALAPELEALYLHEDGTVEAARHCSLPWLAVMWHPERAAPGDPNASDWIGRWLLEGLA